MTGLYGILSLRVPFNDRTLWDIIKCLDACELGTWAWWFPLRQPGTRIFKKTVNMLDPIQQHFGYGQLWLACSQNWARLCKPDPTSHIWFSSVFPKKAWTILCKTDLDPIWKAWSRFGQMHLVWKQASVEESLGPISGRTQLAHCQFCTFRLGCVLPQTSQIILCKTSADLI